MVITIMVWAKVLYAIGILPIHVLGDVRVRARVGTIRARLGTIRARLGTTGIRLRLGIRMRVGLGRAQAQHRNDT